MDRARQLSDIRSGNAPAFRLKATFSFIGSDLETVQGTYTEVWTSSSQWRRETVVNNLRRIDVGSPTRHWLLDSVKDFPEQAARVTGLMELLPPSSANFAFESVVEHAELEPVAQCAITKRDAAHTVRTFCFDKKSGLLLGRISPEVRPGTSWTIPAHTAPFRSSVNTGSRARWPALWTGTAKSRPRSQNSSLRPRPTVHCSRRL
jgi:hypothetical protein